MCGVATHAVGWVCRLRLAEGGVSGCFLGLFKRVIGWVTKPNKTGGFYGFVGSHPNLRLLARGRDWGFRRRLRLSERIVGWKKKKKKQMNFMVLLDLNPTHICYYFIFVFPNLKMPNPASLSDMYHFENLCPIDSP